MTSRKPLLTGLLPSWYRVFTPVLRVFRIETSDPLSRQYPLSIRVPLIVNFFKFFSFKFFLHVRLVGPSKWRPTFRICCSGDFTSEQNRIVRFIWNDERVGRFQGRRRNETAAFSFGGPVATGSHFCDFHKKKTTTTTTKKKETKTERVLPSPRRSVVDLQVGDLICFCFALFFFASDLLFHRLQTDFINNHQRWQRSRRTVRRLRRLCRSTTTTTTKGWNALASPVSDVVDSRFGRRQTKPRRG